MANYAKKRKKWRERKAERGKKLEQQSASSYATHIYTITGSVSATANAASTANQTPKTEAELVHAVAYICSAFLPLLFSLSLSLVYACTSRGVREL